MRKQRPISIRVDAAVYEAIEKIVAREKSNKGRVLREAVDLRIRLDAGAELTRKIIERAAIESIGRIQDAGKEALAEIIDASRRIDESNRQLIVDFIEALKETKPRSAVAKLPPLTAR